MEVIGRTQDGSIRIVRDDGLIVVVNDDMSNADRLRIWDEWEMGPPDPETGERERVNTIPPSQPPGATIEDVAAERDRRLSVGFDYDFGDTRGIHRIATSEGDMRKWMDEVNPISQTFINVGQPDAEITVATETGTVIITATEWQEILLAAFQYRQPLYLASFALQAMDPIPADYADDAYWPT